MPDTLFTGVRTNWTDTSNACIFIDVEDAAAQPISINEYVSAQTANSFEIENNAGSTRYAIIATATTGTAYTITADVTTGTVESVTADSVTTGTGYSLSVDGLTTGRGIFVENVGEVMTSGTLIGGTLTASGATLAVLTGNVGNFTSSVDETRSSGTTTMTDFNTVTISRTSINTTAGGTLAMDGAALLITTTSTETAGTLTDGSFALEIVDNARDDGEGVFAVSITCDNPGTDFAGGIDMTSFSVDEPLIKFITDSSGSNADPAAHAGVDDWICFENSANVLMFCPCYAAST